MTEINTRGSNRSHLQHLLQAPLTQSILWRQRGCAALLSGHFQQQHNLHSQEKHFPLMHCPLKFSGELSPSDFAVVKLQKQIPVQPQYLKPLAAAGSHPGMPEKLQAHPSAARTELITELNFFLIKWMQYPVLPNNINLQMNSLNAIKWTSGYAELSPWVCLQHRMEKSESELSDIKQSLSSKEAVLKSIHD